MSDADIVISAEEKPAKTFPHVAPRIDVDNYQAEVCDTDEQGRNVTTDYQIFSYEASQRFPFQQSTKWTEATEFLIAYRNLFFPDECPDEAWTADTVRQIPMESDPLAMEYLAKFSYNCEAALFKLMSELGFGKDAVYARKADVLVDKQPAAGRYMTCRDATVGAQRWLLGSFRRGHHHHFQPPPLPSPMTAEACGSQISCNSDGSSSNDSNREHNNNNMASDDASVAAESEAGGVTTHGHSAVVTGTLHLTRVGAHEEIERELNYKRAVERPAVDKTALKKAWTAVFKTANDLLYRASRLASTSLSSGVYGESSSSKKPASLEEVQALLDSAHSLPAYPNSPGDEFWDAGQLLMSDLLTGVSQTKLWIADVHDALHGAARIEINSSPAATLAALRSLLKESSVLRVQPVKEIAALKQILLDYRDLNSEARKLLQLCEGVIEAGPAASTSEDVPEGDDEGRELEDLESETSHGASAPGIASSHGTGSRKMTLEYLDEVLRRYAAIPRALLVSGLHQRGNALARHKLDRISKLRSMTESLIEEVEDVLLRADTCSARKYKPPAIVDGAALPTLLRSPLASAEALITKCHSFPVHIPHLPELQNLVQTALAWKAEMKELFGNESASQGKPISLKKVESLISRGEKLPFELHDDLELLRERRLAARQWMEKLKKNFQVKTTGRFSLRKSGESGSGGAGGERLNLADMKLMVQEGEILYEDDLNAPGRSSQQARELSKAQSVVECAEEWLTRMRELLLEGVNNPNAVVMSVDSPEEDGESDENREERPVNIRDVLQSMLDEAKEMPVHLDEVSVLRSFVRSLDWAEKVRKAFAGFLPVPAAVNSAASMEVKGEEETPGSVCEVAEAQSQGQPFSKPSAGKLFEFAKEITSIREEISPEVAKEFCVKELPEETFILKSRSAVETWLASYRKLVQGGNIRRNVRLNKIVEHFLAGLELPVSVRSELRVLASAINRAEEWIAACRPLLELLEVPCESGRTPAAAQFVGADGNRVKEEAEEDEPSAAAAAVVEVGREEGSADPTDRVTGRRAKAQKAKRPSPQQLDTSTAMDVESEPTPTISTSRHVEPTAVSEKCETPEIVALIAQNSEEVETQRQSYIQSGTVSAVAVQGAVTLATLEEVVATAASLPVDFPEIRDLRERLESAQYWIASVRDSCPPFPVEPSSAVTRLSSSQLQHPKAAGAVGGSRYQSLQNLQAMLASGQSLRLFLPDEMTKLLKAIETAREFNTRAASTLSAEIASSCVGLKFYRALTIESVVSLGLDALVASNAAGLESDDPAWRELTALRQKLNNVVEEAEKIGVRVPAAISCEVLIATLEWIDAGRTLMGPPASDNGKGGRRKKIKIPSRQGKNFPCTEYVIEHTEAAEEGAVPLPFLWGDVPSELVARLQAEGRQLLKLIEAIVDKGAATEDAVDQLNLDWTDLPQATQAELLPRDESWEFRRHSARRPVVSRNVASSPVSSAARPDKKASAGAGETKKKSAKKAPVINELEVSHDEEGGALDTASHIPDLLTEGPTSPSAASRPHRNKRKSFDDELKSAAIHLQKHEESVEVKTEKPVKRTKVEDSSKKNKKTASSASVPNGTAAASSAEGDRKPSTKKTKITAESAIENSQQSSEATAAPIVDSVTGPSPSEVPLVELPYDWSTSQRLKKMFTPQDSSFTNAVASVISDQFSGFLRFWLHMLDLLVQRLRQVLSWTEIVDELLGYCKPPTNQRGSSLQPSLVEQFVRCLCWARDHGIRCHQRSYLERQLLAAAEWGQAASNMLSHEQSSLLPLDQFKEFVKLGEGLAPFLAPELDEDPEESVAIVKEASEGCPAEGEIEPKDDAMQIADVAASREEEDKGESLVMARQDVVIALRQEIRKARNWLQDLASSGLDQGASKTDVLESLLRESKSIAVDLSDSQTSIEQSLLKYCLCRQAYHGHMIGCDTCDEWYHLSCVGLSKIQADKIDKYICIRCSMRNSFKQSICNAASIVNRWMNRDEIYRTRETKRSKLVRRRFKEEKDLNKFQSDMTRLVALQAQLQGQNPALALGQLPTPLVDSAVTQSASTSTGTPTEPSPASSAEEALPTTQTSSVGSVVPPAPTLLPMGGSGTETVESINRQLAAAKQEALMCLSRLQEIAAEETSFQVQVDLETTRLKSIMEWMEAMQGVIWPNNPVDLEIGKPLAPPQVASDADPLSLESLGLLPALRGLRLTTSAISGQSLIPSSIDNDGLLSPGMAKAAVAATALFIEKLDDVREIFNIFRWASWINLALHALRQPISSQALRTLVLSGQALPTSDYSVIRFMGMLVAKSSAWKNKVRKATVSMKRSIGQEAIRRIETSKLISLVLEGNCVPIASRLKDQLREAFSKISGNGDFTAAMIGDGEEPAEGEATTAGTLGKRAAAKAAAAVVAAPSSATHTFLYEDTVNSSDDESVLASNVNLNDGRRRPISRKRYTSLPTYALAPPPPELWPVTDIGFGPVKPLVRSAVNPVATAPGESLVGSEGSSSSSSSSMSLNASVVSENGRHVGDADPGNRES